MEEASSAQVVTGGGEEDALLEKKVFPTTSRLHSTEEQSKPKKNR